MPPLAPPNPVIRRGPAPPDRVAAPVRGPFAAYLHRHLPPCGDRALDLGCGTGKHAWLLSLLFADVLAVDACAPLLQFAQRHRPAVNIRYQLRNPADVTADRDGQFDVILATYALGHSRDLPGALQQIRRPIRPGGQVIALVDHRGRRRRVPPRPSITEACTTLLLDLRRQRRSIPAAVDGYRRVRQHVRLDHSSRLSAPEQIEQACAAVLPGAQLIALPTAMVIHWREPARP